MNQLFITLFYSRFVNEVDGVSIMLDSTDKQVIQKVVNEVRQFLTDAHCIYQYLIEMLDHMNLMKLMSILPHTL